MSPEFFVHRIGARLYIAHQLPGELRIFALIDPIGMMEKEDHQRYADMIVEALNKEPK